MITLKENTWIYDHNGVWVLPQESWSGNTISWQNRFCPGGCGFDVMNENHTEAWTTKEKIGMNTYNYICVHRCGAKLATVLSNEYYGIK
jgi:hypothetical protein